MEDKQVLKCVAEYGQMNGQSFFNVVSLNWTGSNWCKRFFQCVIRSEVTLGDLRDGKSRNCLTDLMVRVLQLAIVNPPHQSGVDGL